MDTLQLDNELNALILQGKNSEAFLKYYDENVVAQENDEPERKGREQWMRDAVIKGMGAMRMVQVAVRRWKNGRVVRERFYHKT
jgi:hypothetical protein